MNAFLQLRTLSDLADLIALLKQGATVGIEPVPGSLFGPAMPPRFHIRDDWGKATKRRHYPPTTLDAFLIDYMGFSGRVPHVTVSPCPEVEVIREAWRILNHAAALPVSRIQMAKLGKLLASHYGGAVEFQIGYGAPEWVEWVKGKHGLVTLWCDPGPSEIDELVRFGATGLINAVEAQARRPWFTGMSGPYLMPDKGLIRYSAGMTPEAAWNAAGEPTGISPEWDRINAFYRLAGVVAAPEATDEEVKALGLAVRHCGAKSRSKHYAKDHAVRPVPVIPRKEAAAWIAANPNFVRVDFK